MIIVCHGRRALRSTIPQFQVRRTLKSIAGRNNNPSRINVPPRHKPWLKGPEFAARTRFAPSPTGFLHLGSLRTALFNYLLAKSSGGQFILRIEDTDQRRTVPGARERLCEELRWAGLEWDEGPDVGGPHGPYIQSERVSIYKEHAEDLLTSRYAYRCFGNREENREHIHEDGKTCSELSSDASAEKASQGEPYVIRLRTSPEPIEVFDLIYGRQRHDFEAQNRRAWQKVDSCEADVVLIKRDGFPTYHFANVIDDHLMDISHVIRANEWLVSTPIHLRLYRAFGWEPPQYAHVGLLLDDKGQKLSKRVGDPSRDLRAMREIGYFPEAVINYLALYGWSHTMSSDFLKMEDLVQNFDLQLTRTNVMVSPGKLDFLQKEHAVDAIKEKSPLYDRMLNKLCDTVLNAAQDGTMNLIVPKSEVKARAMRALETGGGRYVTNGDFFDQTAHLFFRQKRPALKLANFHGFLTGNLDLIRECFATIPAEDWFNPMLVSTSEPLRETFGARAVAASEATDHKVRVNIAKTMSKEFMGLLRWLVTFGSSGPSLMTTMETLGREETLSRMDDGIATLKNEMAATNWEPIRPDTTTAGKMY